MESTAILLTTGFVFGYLAMERIFVTPPKFLPFYILLSALMVMMTI